MAAMAAISEGEVAVYDRQLRLWGVQAQQRLLQSKVLIWGLEGSNVEACKNLVLAGVSLTVRDHRAVTDADVAYNYFLRSEDIGKGRADCASKRIGEMNPLNSMSSSDAVVEDSAEKLRDGLRGFDVVILGVGVVGWDANRAAAVNAACREVGACFFLTTAAGELAFFFSDMLEHTVQERSGAQGGGAGSTATTEKPAQLETISFPSFDKWLAVSPLELIKAKVDASVVLVALFLAFGRENDCKEPSVHAAKFADFCRDRCGDNVLAVDGIKDLKHAFEMFFVEPLMHVTSIIGGLMAQEVIKAITKRDPPLVNTICFNAQTCAAIVEHLPAVPKESILKRKAEESFDLDD